MYDDINHHNTLFYNYTSIDDQFANPEEVRTIIKHMKSNKTPGDDEITIDFIKRHIHPLAIAITHLFNVSLKNGKFPDPLKIAKTIPIFKDGDKTIVSNYRPISLSSAISKILEKLIHNRLYAFFNDQKLFFKHQYGFRPRSSTQTAAIELVNNLQSWIDNGNCSSAIFIDISKAFDTIKHSILLKKLYYYGIRGRTYFLMNDYLKDRK